MRAACTLSMLVLLSFVACSIKPRTAASGVARPSAQAPTGSFVGPSDNPVLKLRLETDGTYIAEDIGPPEFWFMMEGNKVYPQRIKLPPQKGRWTWDSETGQMMLTAETPASFRWGIQHLRADKDNPERLAWGGSFLERAETVELDPTPRSDSLFSFGLH